MMQVGFMAITDTTNWFDKSQQWIDEVHKHQGKTPDFQKPKPYIDNRMKIYEVAATQQQEVDGKTKTQIAMPPTQVTARSKTEAAFKAGSQLASFADEDYDIIVREFV